MKDEKLLFIVGPTASGKSELAMQVARDLNGEIVCADSQTIRKDLDIGTAKPTLDDRKLVKHHMLDIIEPYERYSVAEYKKEANGAISEIQKRNKLPIIVGGTGLYIDALLYDFQFRTSSGVYSREELESMTVNELQEIIKKLEYKMPKNEQNPRHLIRTIESKGEESKKSEVRKNAIIVGVDPGKDILDSRINIRVEKMIATGFINEVEEVLEKYGKPPQNIDAIGYKIALDCRLSKGEYDLAKLKTKFAQADKSYAKRQRVWFKRNRNIVWFEQPDTAFEYTKNALSIF